MARIPTKYDLSGQGSLRSGRTISSYDTSGIGRGVEALGRGLGQIADEMSFEQRQAKEQQNVVDIARAEAVKTKGLLDVQNTFENDNDYATFGKRGNPEVDKAISSAAVLIRDPKMRERYIATQQEAAVRGKDWLTDKATDKKRSAEIVAFDKSLETNKNLYADPNTTEDVKTKALSDIQGSIDMGLKSGLITPEQAANRKLAYVEKAKLVRGMLEAKNNPDSVRQSNVQAQDIPEEGRALLDSIAATESPGYNVIHGGQRFESYADHPRVAVPIGNGKTSSAAGRYQFIGSTWDRASKALGLKDFSPANQDRAAWWLAQQDYASDTHRNLLEDLKSKDPEVLAQVRHSLGNTWEGLKLQGDNAFIGNYMKGPKGKTYIDELPPEDRQRIYDQADATQKERSVIERSSIEVATQNAPAAIQNTGAYTGQMPSQDQFVRAYGPEDGYRKYDEFQASVDTSQKAFDMRTMSSGDIQKMVSDAKPTSSGDAAALEAAKYDVLSKAAATTLAAREADPVTYVRNTYPAVNQAWDEASATGSYQNAIASTAAAQAQLGIRNPAVMPKDIAAQTVATFKSDTTPQDQKVSQLTGLVFGSTNDKTQQQAIFNQLVDAGLPSTTEGALEAYARGDEGAGNRLMAAATVDVSKLPGKSPNTADEISQQIQFSVMDEGKIGDLYYGLTDGTADNQERAIRDSRLLTNAVTIRIRNGEALEDAVDAAARDLYGNVKPISVPNARILVPADSDPTSTVDGLSALKPTVREQLDKNMEAAAQARMTGESVSTGDAAILKETARVHSDNIMSQGYFVNAGQGFVYIDPFLGQAIPDEKGKPMVFTPAQVQSGAQPLEERIKRVIPAARDDLEAVGDEPAMGDLKLDTTPPGVQPQWK